MNPNVQRRLERLEQQHAPTLRERFVWWDEGEPEPKAEPGERLIIIRWLWQNEELPPANATAARNS